MMYDLLFQHDNLCKSYENNEYILRPVTKNERKLYHIQITTRILRPIPVVPTFTNCK